MTPWPRIAICVACWLLLKETLPAQGNDLIDLSQLGARGVAFETVAKGAFSLQDCTSVGDFNGDGYSDIAIIGRETSTFAEPWLPPIFYLVYGRPAFTGLHELDGSLDSALTLRSLDYEETRLFPSKVYSIGDLDQDGLADILVFLDNFVAEPGLSPGMSLLFYGAPGLNGEGFLDEIGEGKVRGAQLFSANGDVNGTGYGAANIGDFNGDGTQDLALSAFMPQGAPDRKSLVCVLFRTQNLSQGADLGSLGVTVPGLILRFPSRSPVYPAAAGDVNGDGIDDLLVSNKPYVFLLFGRKSFPPVLDVADALSASDDTALRDLGAVVIAGPVDADNLNFGLNGQAAGIGDIDKDGFADFIIGAAYRGIAFPGASPRQSVVYLFYGGTSLPQRLSFDSVPQGLARRIIPSNDTFVGTSFGWTLGGTGDVNGDGQLDFAIGATEVTQHGWTDAGEVDVIYGGERTTEDLSLDQGFEGIKIAGETSYGRIGEFISAVRDFDGDGAADILIGGRGSGPGAIDNRAYVIYGTGSHGAPLTVLDLEPTAGPLRGSTRVHLSGSGFEEGMKVRFGAEESWKVTVLSSAEATAESPSASSAGGVNVTVELNGESRTLKEPFEYVAVLPEIDLADPGRFGLRVDGLSGYEIGRALSFGDVTGDGVDDLVIASLASGEWVVSIASGGRDLPAKLQGFVPSVRLSLIRGPFPSGQLRGVDASTLGDINGDGVDDIGVGASDGSAYILFGKSEFAEESTIETALAAGNGLRLETPGVPFGRFTYVPIGDIDGDGIEDFALGLSSGVSSVLSNGQLVLVGGRKTWPESLDLTDDQGVLARVTSGDSDFANEVALLGDVDGDGHADLLVSSGPQSTSTQAYVLRGGSILSTETTLQDRIAAGGIITLRRAPRNAAFTSYLHMAGPGDVNGDGYADMLIADETAGSHNQGVTFLIHGGSNLPDVITLTDDSDFQGVRILGPAERVQSGRALGPAGDFTGDGIADFIIGAQNSDPFSPGTLSIVYGGKDLPRTLDLRRPGQHGFTMQGIQSVTLLQVSARQTGDLNGDGNPDFAFSEMGSPDFPSKDGVPSPGAVHVVFGLPKSFPFVRGDSTFDGEINITDAIFVLDYLFLGGLSPECEDAADADDDGALEITDAIYILSSLFLGGSPPREPFPGKGPDPTEDRLGCRGY